MRYHHILILFLVTAVLGFASFVALNVPATHAATETFYVTATGRGAHSGTSLANAFSATDFNTSSNWSSVNAVDGKIGPGDTVIMYSDDGTFPALTAKASGLAGAPIVIEAAPGEQPIVEATSGIVFSLYGRRRWVRQ